MRSEEEIKRQIAGVRDRVGELSGFWLGEGAAMIYVLEWVLGKRETVPAGELGLAGGDSEQIAVNLAKRAEKAAAQALASARAGAEARAESDTRKKPPSKLKEEPKKKLDSPPTAGPASATKEPGKAPAGPAAKRHRKK